MKMFPTSYVNEADTIVWDEDPDDWTSMTYSGWANVSLDRWKTGPYWNEKSQTANPPLLINGKAQFPSGNFLIADSALRNANFVTVIETKDFDLSEAADVHLGFYSHYTQNQDNSASVEYSIDGGDTWLPVLYMLDQADIVAVDDGTVDAEATLNAAHGDVALVNNILFQDDDEIWDMEPLEEALGGSSIVGGHLPEALLDHRAERSHAAGAARAFASMATFSLLALPELDDEHSPCAARRAKALIRAVAGISRQGLI